MPGLLLDTLKGHRSDQVPMWLMRQAGRYLPEYRALRAEKGGFLELVYDTEAAAEVTLQPIRRFGFDGAILFSDILIVPYAMGQDLTFLAGEGPHLSPRLADHALAGLESVPERLDPIYATVAAVKAGLGPETTLLGFAGSPWTVATYMVAGQGSKDQAAARRHPCGNTTALRHEQVVHQVVQRVGGVDRSSGFRLRSTSVLAPEASLNNGNRCSRDGACTSPASIAACAGVSFSGCR